MADADSKAWRPHATNNIPAIDAEIAGESAKNCGYECKILAPQLLPSGFEGHTVRHFYSDITPTAATYPDSLAPIGSYVTKLTINGSGVVTNADKYLKTASNTWVLVAGGSGVSAVLTSAYTVLNTDILVLADTSGGAFTVTLPTAATSEGVAISFKNVGTGVNALTIDGAGAELIDGAATYAAMDAQYDTVTIISDGTGWHVISEVLA